MSDDNRKKDVGMKMRFVPVMIPVAIVGPACARSDCPVHGEKAQAAASKVGYSREYADRFDSIFGKKQVVGQA